MPVRGGTTLFHIRGIRVGVDWTWFLILFFIVYALSGFYRDITGATDDAVEPYFLAVISAIAFFGSILLHELGHAIVALRNGIGISDITLWMFGGIAHMKRDTDSPGVEFRVAIAGPAVTLAIVVVLFGAGTLIAGGREFIDAAQIESSADVSGAVGLLAWLAFVNVLLFVFNLIPAFPMDGGRVLRAAAWKKTGSQNRGTRIAARIGQGFSYGFIALGLAMAFSGNAFSGIWLAVIGFFIGQSARATVLQTEMRSRIEGITVGDVMDDEPVAIPDDATVETALDEYFLRYQWPWFPVIDSLQRFTGMIKRGAADAVPAEARGDALVGEIFDGSGAADQQIGMDEPIETLFGNEELRRLGALAAVDSDGRLTGVVTLEQVTRALRSAVVNPAEGGGE